MLDALQDLPLSDLYYSYFIYDLEKKNFILVFCSLHPIKDCILMLKLIHCLGIAGFVLHLKIYSLVCRNIENNLFSGPIPAKLLGIPNFR